MCVLRVVSTHGKLETRPTIYTSQVTIGSAQSRSGRCGVRKILNTSGIESALLYID